MIINRSKPINFISTLVISILTIAGFYGCFGGGGGGGGSLSTTTTSGALFTSSGTITGFGSVHVNNTRFITTLATILNDGQLVNQSDLSIGMKVTVRASSSNVASQTSFEEDVEGPVDVNDNSGTLTVLGQVVITDASTIFVGGNLAALTPGTVVEVSGFRNGNDEIIATFIELQNNPPNDYEVVGPVRNLDTAAMTFEIGGLTVNYSGANLNDFPNGQSMNGQIVEVEDALLSYVVGSFNLSATEVEPEEPLGGEINPGERVEIENIVTQVISPNSFMLGNLIVITDGNTRFLFT